MMAEVKTRRARGFIGRRVAILKKRLSGRPDSEHDMTLNRLALSTLVLIYLVVAWWRGHGAAEDIFEEALILFAIYYVASIVLFVDIVRDPGVSHPRRIVALVLDIGMLSYGMHVGESAFAIGYPLYLWIILGNGFRFGVRYLIGAALLAIAGFCLLIMATPLWRSNLELSFGLLAGLFLLPAYVSALIKKLSEAKSQAEEASKAKSLFLASVSHELRTPLNAIITLSDLLRTSPIAPEQRDMSETIGQSGRSLLKLINSILDLSRMEARKDEPDAAPFDLFEMLQGLRRMLSASAETKGLYLNVCIERGVAAALIGQRHYLEEILTNLVGNATKFTDVGGVLLRVSQQPDDGLRHLLRFSVVDTGIGIPKAAQSRIFEQFTQADSTIIDRFGGTGLGLAIVKKLVEQLGGEIGVRSETGMGSEFWFTMPLMPVSVIEPAEFARPNGLLLSHDFALYTQLALGGGSFSRLTDPGRAISELKGVLDSGQPGLLFVDADTMPIGILSLLQALDPGGQVLRRTVVVLLARDEGRADSDVSAPFLINLQVPLLNTELAQIARLMAERVSDAMVREVAAPLKVLVAEDNATNQTVIRKVLQRDHHDVTIVNNGEEAVELLLKNEYDIVLMDINMPVMNGLDATKLFRFASLGSRRVPIYALTADVTEQTRKNCLDAGMDGCLHKPINQDELQDTLQSVGKGVVAFPNSQHTGKAQHALSAPQGVRKLSDIDVLDEKALLSLLELGDMSFMQELIVQFLAGADETLTRISGAVERMDLAEFHDVLHALRSSAANLGARRVFAISLEWRRTTREELANEGEERVASLRQHLVEAERALKDWLVRQGSALRKVG